MFRGHRTTVNVSATNRYNNNHVKNSAVRFLQKGIVVASNQSWADMLPFNYLLRACVSSNMKHKLVIHLFGDLYCFCLKHCEKKYRVISGWFILTLGSAFDRKMALYLPDIHGSYILVRIAAQLKEILLDIMKWMLNSGRCRRKKILLMSLNVSCPWIEQVTVVFIKFVLAIFGCLFIVSNFLYCCVFFTLASCLLWQFTLL